MNQNNFDFLIQPSDRIAGKTSVPGDKSISHRCLILASIAQGQSIIKNCLMGEDNLATLKALANLGVNYQFLDAHTLMIDGVGLYGLKPSQQILNLGNSGTAIRLLTGLLAAQNFASELIGDSSLMTRPMARVAKPLAQMGANIKLTQDQYPPIKIYPNQLTGTLITLEVVSAQVKSAVLLAALYAKGKTTVCFSEPTRNHSEIMLKLFGVKLDCQDQQITIYQQKSQLKGQTINVVGDISSASFLIAAGLMSANGQNKFLTIKNVGINPTRSSVLKIMQLMGAQIKLKNQVIESGELKADIEAYPSNLKGIIIPEYLVANAIDEIPVLMILAAFAKGETVLKNAQELRVKESDRIQSISVNLKKLGLDCQEYADGLKVIGNNVIDKLKNNTTLCLDSFNDHRIAMAFSLASLKIKQDIIIKNCKNVETSFPNYVQLMRNLGLKIKIIPN